MDRNLTKSDQAFCDLACRLGFLSESEAGELNSLAKSTSRSLRALVIRRGRLTAQQLDILETLLSPREIVPGYEILDVIGRGGMGIVYRAKQLALSRVVAIKTVLMNQLEKPGAAQRFEIEAVSIAKVAHPHIVTAFDFGQHEGRLFLVMELVSGVSLQDLLDSWDESGLDTERGADEIPTVEAPLNSLATSGLLNFEQNFPSSELHYDLNRPKIDRLGEDLAYVRDDSQQRTIFMLGIARQIAAGLALADSHGIVHRDIKPANILLSERPHGLNLPGEPPLAKLMDFGLALLSNPAEIQEESRITREGATVGSPHYMAPEQLNGESVDRRADIYALGATLFHILKGRAPSAELPFGKLISNKATTIPFDAKKDLPDIAPGVSQFLSQLLQPNPNDRTSDYRQILYQVDLLLDQLTDRTRSIQATRSPATLGDDIRVDTERELASIYESIPEKSLTSSGNRQESKILSRRQALLGGGALAGSTLVATWLGVQQWSPNRSRSTWQTLPRGEQRNLFNGQSLEGWDLTNRCIGGWATSQAPDGSTAISCTSSKGAVSRRIPAWPELSISASLWLGTGESIELQFAQLETNRDFDRWFLRLNSEGFELGQRKGDFGNWKVHASLAKPRLDQERYLGVTLDRQDNSWYVFVEEQLLGEVPAQVGERLEIRLASLDSEHSLPLNDDADEPTGRSVWGKHTSPGWFAELSVTQYQSDLQSARPG